MKEMRNWCISRLCACDLLFCCPSSWRGNLNKQIDQQWLWYSLMLTPRNTVHDSMSFPENHHRLFHFRHRRSHHLSDIAVSRVTLIFRCRHSGYFCDIADNLNVILLLKCAHLLSMLVTTVMMLMLRYLLETSKEEVMRKIIFYALRHCLFLLGFHGNARFCRFWLWLNVKWKFFFCSQRM